MHVTPPSSFEKTFHHYSNIWTGYVVRPYQKIRRQKPVTTTDINMVGEALENSSKYSGGVLAVDYHNEEGMSSLLEAIQALHEKVEEIYEQTNKRFVLAARLNPGSDDVWLGTDTPDTGKISFRTKSLEKWKSEELSNLYIGFNDAAAPVLFEARSIVAKGLRQAEQDIRVEIKNANVFPSQAWHSHGPSATMPMSEDVPPTDLPVKSESPVNSMRFIPAGVAHRIPPNRQDGEWILTCFGF